MVEVNNLTPHHHSAAFGSGTPKSRGQFYVKRNLKSVLHNLEGLQQLLAVHDAQLVGGGGVLGEVHSGEEVEDIEHPQELAVLVEELGLKSVGGDLVVGDFQLHGVCGGVGVEHRLKLDARIVVHTHGLDLVGLLHTLDDVLAVGFRTLVRDLSYGVGSGAAVAGGRAACGHYARLAKCREC